MTVAQDSQRAAEKAMAAPRIEAVRALASAGKNGPQIAAELGMTRGQVMGLCHRNGIRLGKAPVVEAPRRIPATGANGDRCRFPLWGNEPPTHRYCCKRARWSGEPYCARHHARTHQRIMAVVEL